MSFDPQPHKVIVNPLKPDDWELYLQQPWTKLGNYRKNGFYGVFADGRVQWLPRVISDDDLRRLFLADDKMVIEFPIHGRR